MWNIEGSTVELTLTKQDGMHWWNSVIKVGDASLLRGAVFLPFFCFMNM
jgi:hypothetical protein